MNVLMDLISVVVINDHQLMTDLLTNALTAQGYNITASFSEIEKGISYIHKTQPALVVIDMMMPFQKQPNGIRAKQDQPYILYDSKMSFNAVQTIKSNCPNTKILMLTGERHPHVFLKGFAAGAHGIASKVDDLQTFSSILERVMTGSSGVTSDRIKLVLKAYKSTKVPELTEPEVHILELVQEGLESREMGKRLGYTAKTVRNKLSEINQKLGTSNRFEAVEVATEMGLVGWRTGYESRI